MKYLFSPTTKNEIGVLLLLHLIGDRNPHIFNCRKSCRGGKYLVSSCPGVAFATPCHPMATGLTLSSLTVQLKGVKCSFWRTMKCHKLLVLGMMVKQEKGEFRVSKLSKVDHTFKFPRPHSRFPRPQSVAKTAPK